MKMKLLFFVTKQYSFSILKPLLAEAVNNGHSVKWFIMSKGNNQIDGSERLFNTDEVNQFDPEAVIVPGNVVPDYWPGLKVQIFHGLGEEKKGHYRITNFFDLYCTPGPVMTNNFNQLAEKYGSFLVRETGWPKLDHIRTDNQDIRKKELGFDSKSKLIFYAPTFSPRYSSATSLVDEIRNLSKNEEYSWVLKFHPLMDNKIVDRYNFMSSKNLIVYEHDDNTPCMEAADILLTDTSSIAYEFLILDRPMITFRSTTRKDKGINIKEPVELKNAIDQCFSETDEFRSNRKKYLKELHPYIDSKSSMRLLNTIQDVMESNAVSTLKKKKPNWYQKKQIQKLVS